MGTDAPLALSNDDRAMDDLLEVLAREMVERYLAELAEASHPEATASEVLP